MDHAQQSNACLTTKCIKLGPFTFCVKHKSLIFRVSVTAFIISIVELVHARACFDIHL